MKPVCVITGGGSGMGRATAKLVCEAGYHVILALPQNWKAPWPS